jgi:hypothetical protein
LKQKEKNIFVLWSNIAFIWINGYLETLPDSFRDLHSPKRSFKKIRLILKYFASDLLKIFKRSRIPKDKVWFLVLTNNNLNALKSVQAKTSNSIFISYFRWRSQINDRTYYFNFRLKFLYNLLFPFFLTAYFIHGGRKIKTYYDIYFSVNGLYEESLRLLKRTKPRAIIFANDHLVIARSLLLAANDLGIKTYYIQHASVSEFFPPLEFTYSLLEGRDALDKYKKSGALNTHVKLVGMPKIDKYSNQINKKPIITSVGIAFNLLDEIEAVFKVADRINNSFPDLEIVLRPHPSDKRDLRLLKEYKLSDSKCNDSFSFLSKIDLLIAGDSSILLEATLMNVYSVYYLYNPSAIFDYYGFLKNGLVEYCENETQLLDLISKIKIRKPDVHERAKYYNETVGTSDFGRSSDLILEILQNTIS